LLAASSSRWIAKSRTALRFPNFMTPFLLSKYPDGLGFS
jgi:hypothetical protein